MYYAADCILWQNECMPLIQVRDAPEYIYRLLAKQAEEERRSLAQQVVAVLARGLNAEIDAKGRRRKALQAIQASGIQTGKVSDPAKLIREDRRR
jgi:hypothetical protein